MSRIYKKSNSDALTGIAFGGGGGRGRSSRGGRHRYHSSTSQISKAAQKRNARKLAQEQRNRHWARVRAKQSSTTTSSACFEVNTGAPGGSATYCVNSDKTRTVTNCVDSNTPGFGAKVCRTTTYKN